MLRKSSYYLAGSLSIILCLFILSGCSDKAKPSASEEMEKPKLK
ncbi:hypothetical protein ACFFHH_21230 [Cytobacillus solani]|nr:hypothetical protein [Cytobacillus solani]